MAQPDDLRTRYVDYIRCLNERRFDDLRAFVADHVTYNGQAFTRDDYRVMLVGDTTAIPDLFFDVQLLVVEGDHVAARLAFRCTPQRAFLGFRPDGRVLSFAENVFYRFDGGRIGEVWSLIDRHAIEQQLGTARRIASFPDPA